MNEYEKFFFDLYGYLVVENALTPAQRALLEPPYRANRPKVTAP
jgi:hypothetical protein